MGNCMTSRDGQEWTTASNDNSTKIKYHFELWINCKILKCSLKSIDEHYRPTSKYKSGESRSVGDDGQPCRQIVVKHLWDYFNSKDEKGSGYEKLLTCLKHSFEEGHLGHDSLFELLTGNSGILESYDYKCNVAVQRIVRANLSSFIRLTNVAELLPFMYQKELTTLDETTGLLHGTIADTNSDQPAWYILTELLDTKGHRGYIVFVECLKDSVKREDHHIGHWDIIRDISSQLEPQGLYIGKYTDGEGVPL